MNFLLLTFRAPTPSFSGQYKPFNEITRSSLGHALAEHGLTLSSAQAEDLMRAYDALGAFPEVPAAMRLLKEHEGALEPYIFSNGTATMVAHSVKTSPDLGPHEARFRDLVSVEDLRCYKPDPRTYMHLAERAGRRRSPIQIKPIDGEDGEDEPGGGARDVWVVSANPFDVAGAKAAGLRAAFIDRAGRGWTDRLDEMSVPSIIASGVDEAIREILNY